MGSICWFPCVVGGTIGTPCSRVIGSLSIPGSAHQEEAQFAPCAARGWMGRPHVHTIWWVGSRCALHLVSVPSCRRSPKSDACLIAWFHLNSLPLHRSIQAFGFIPPGHLPFIRPFPWVRCRLQRPRISRPYCHVRSTSSMSRVNPRTRPSTCASCPRGRATWSGRTAPAMRRGDRAVRRESRGPPTVSSPPSDGREGRGVANRGHPAPRVSGHRETDGPEPASWQSGQVPPRGPHGPLSLREKNGPCIEGRPLWPRNRHVSPAAPKGKSGLQYPPLGGASPGEQGNVSTRRRDVGSCAPLSPRSHVSPFLRSDWSVGNTWGEDDRWQGIQQPSPVPFLSNADDPTSDRTDNRTSRFPIGPIRGGARDRCRGFVPSVHRYLPSIIDIFHRYLRVPPGPPRLPGLSSPFEPERVGIRSPIVRGPSRKGSHRFPAVLLRSEQKSHRVAIGARAFAPPSFARASSTARDVVRRGKSGRRGIERGAPCPMPETRLTTRGA